MRSNACSELRSETDERNVRALPRRDRTHLLDVDLAGDHVVPEPDDDLGEQLEPVAPLVRDQDAEMANVILERLEVGHLQDLSRSAGVAACNEFGPPSDGVLTERAWHVGRVLALAPRVGHVPAFWNVRVSPAEAVSREC